MDSGSAGRAPYATPPPAVLDLGGPVAASVRRGPPPVSGDPVLLLLDVAGQRRHAAGLAPALLDAGERARAAAFLHAADRDCYQVAHVALRLVLGHATGTDPARVRPARLPCPVCGRAEGRPVLRGDGAPHFSLSHTRGWVLLALAARPVGVDVEQVPSAAAVRELRGMLAPAEAAEIAELPAPAGAPAFARAWARKEACGKAVGTGLLHGALHRYVGTGERAARPPDGLRLLDVPAPPGHAAAVAVRGPDGPADASRTAGVTEAG